MKINNQTGISRVVSFLITSMIAVQFLASFSGAVEHAAQPASELTASSETKVSKIKSKSKDVKGSKSKGEEKQTSEKKSDTAKKDLNATIQTSLGEIKVKLFKDTTPITVDNFEGLAKGTKEWTNPKTKKKTKTPLYSGTIFHRVIPGFMIQGGDPLGNGTGGPGYEFADETKPTDQFNRPGLLAMANAGPNTNGSQFFITVKETPWLNGRHTLFGEVIKGMDIVLKIAASAKDDMDKPLKPITIKKIVIE